MNQMPPSLARRAGPAVLVVANPAIRTLWPPCASSAAVAWARTIREPAKPAGNGNEPEPWLGDTTDGCRARVCGGQQV
jgi:hypothetical protein